MGKEAFSHWVYHECVSSYDGCKSGYACSNCGAFVDENIFDMDEFHKKFCGNCGEMMAPVGVYDEEKDTWTDKII